MVPPESGDYLRERDAEIAELADNIDFDEAARVAAREILDDVEASIRVLVTERDAALSARDRAADELERVALERDPLPRHPRRPRRANRGIQPLGRRREAPPRPLDRARAARPRRDALRKRAGGPSRGRSGCTRGGGGVKFSIVWCVSDARGRFIRVGSRNEALSLAALYTAEGFGEHFPFRVLRSNPEVLSVEFVPFARTDRRRLRSREVGHA